jgi:hypothetical protein
MSFIPHINAPSIKEFRAMALVLGLLTALGRTTTAAPDKFTLKAPIGLVITARESSATAYLGLRGLTPTIPTPNLFIH